MEVQVLSEFVPNGETHSKNDQLIQSHNNNLTLSDIQTTRNRHSDLEISQLDRHRLGLNLNLPTPKKAQISGRNFVSLSPSSHDSDKKPNLAIDEEIFISGASVVVSRAARVVSSYSFNVPVQHALFAFFDMEHIDVPGALLQQPNYTQPPQSRTPTRALVILVKDIIRFYFDSGSVFSSHLPMIARRVWALDVGILVERDLEATERETGLQVSRYFTLKHPLELFRHVASDNSPSVGFMDVDEDPTERNDFLPRLDEQIVYVGNSKSSMPIIITFNESTSCHQIHSWKFRQPVDFLAPLPPSIVDLLKTSEDQDPCKRISNMSIVPSESPEKASTRLSMDPPHSERLEAADQENPLAWEDNLEHLRIQRPVMYCSKVYETRITDEPCEIFFLHADQTYINFQTKTTKSLHVYTISSNLSLHPVVTLPALSAVPIRATNLGSQDLLVLTPDWQLKLFFGYLTHPELSMNLHIARADFDGEFSSPLSMSPPSVSSARVVPGAVKRRRSTGSELLGGPEKKNRGAPIIPSSPLASQGPLSVPPRPMNRSPSRSSRVLELVHSVGDRVNLIMSDGKTFRCRVDFRPRSRLVNLVLSSLKSSLPIPLWGLVWNRLCQVIFTKNDVWNLLNEWESLVVALFSFWVPFSEIMPRSSDMESLRSEDREKTSPDLIGNSAWNHLQSTSLHLKSARSKFLSKAFSRTISDPKLEPVTAQTSQTAKLQGLYSLAKGLYMSHHTESQLYDRMDSMLLALHLVYEELKLDTAQVIERVELGAVCASVSNSLGWKDWNEYYLRDGIIDGENIIHVPPQIKFAVGELSENPPSLYKYLSKLQRGYSLGPFISLDTICDICTHLPTSTKRNKVDLKTERIIRVWRAFFCEEVDDEMAFHRGNSRPGGLVGVPSYSRPLSSPSRDLERRNPYIRAIKEMAAVNLTVPEMDCLPLGIGIPLREIAHHGRTFASGRWSSQMLQIVGRSELMESIDKSFQTAPIGAEVKHIKSKVLGDVATVESELLQAPSKDMQQVSDLGASLARLRFPQDQRLKEVDKILRVGDPVKLTMAHRPELSEDNVTEHQDLLKPLAARVYSLAVGRAIFNYGTSSKPSNNPFDIPELVCAAKIPPLYNTVTYDVSTLPANYLNWPEFHNGVAMGLTLVPQSTEVDESWMHYNQPALADPRRLGFLFALALNGHLRKMQPWRAFSYLSIKEEVTAVSLLLGLSGGMAGSQDEKIKSMLAVHISPLKPPQTMDCVIEGTIQAAALLGMGLLYQGSVNRQLAEMLLQEIGRREFSSTAATAPNREAYSLSAGLALGLVTLGKGEEALGFKDMHVVDELRKFMFGGLQSSLIFHARTRQSTPEDKSHVAVAYMENENINIDVTAPGATLALALMYLKTNTQSIANKILIPDTIFNLDHVRPDFLLLRILSRNLIMWDNICPTEEWIMSQVPQLIKEKMGISMRAAGRASPILSAIPTMDEDERKDSITHAYYSIITGACFSIGFKYAGSLDERVLEFLLLKYDLFLGRISVPANDFSSKLTRTLVKSCFDVLVLSLGMVMAGSGNLEVLRRLRKLHQRLEKDVNYGSHMAVSMAIGFLFLGGGAYTLGTSNQAIAALVISMFPKMPLDANDNKFHLQAYRHLWVLAVEPRCLLTRDSVTRELVSVPIRVTFEDVLSSVLVRSSTSRDVLHGVVLKSKDLVTPCVLPELKLLRRIELRSDRYWPLQLDFASDSNELKQFEKSFSLVVKRKTGYLSHVQDPQGFRTIDLQTSVSTIAHLTHTNQNSLDDRRTRRDFLQSFVADPEVLGFAAALCQPYPSSNLNLAKFATSVLVECLSMDKPQMLQIYISFFTSVQQLKNDKTISGDFLDDVLMLRSFYSELFNPDRWQEWRTDDKFLLHRDFLFFLDLSVQEYFETALVAETSSLEDSLEVFLSSPGLVRIDDMVGAYLKYFDVPSHSVVSKLREWKQNTKTERDPALVSAIKGKLGFNSEIWNLIMR